MKQSMYLVNAIAIIAVIIFTNGQITDCYSSCGQSIPTISYVESCPRNKIDWDMAAKRKNCEIMAPYQNCTEPENFKYHCLINELLNATLEICAPIYYLPGHCAIYNTVDKDIKENYKPGFECSKYPKAERCPSRYPSTEGYKYLRCFAQTNPRPACTTINSTSPTIEIKLRSDVKYIVCIIILAALLTVLLIVLVIWRKMKSIIRDCFKECKRKNSQSTIPGETVGLKIDEDSIQDKSANCF